MSEKWYDKATLFTNSLTVPEPYLLSRTLALIKNFIFGVIIPLKVPTFSSGTIYVCGIYCIFIKEEQEKVISLIYEKPLRVPIFSSRTTG